MRFLILIVFFFVLYTNSYGITKEYNLIDKKLIIFTDGEISNDLDYLIEKKFDAILSVIDVNEPDSFVSRFNELERNSQVSAPDYFVDAFLILKNYNKISKGSFDPTIFSIISKSKKVKKITKLLNTSSTRRCISMNNIKVKASNIFFKVQGCTKLSFDSVISGIVVENLKSLLVNNNISNFSIIYNGTISNFNQTLDIKNYFDLQKKI
jgi:Membrane-associated lipoprotein involved in thiamine biosynthesis